MTTETKITHTPGPWFTYDAETGDQKDGQLDIGAGKDATDGPSIGHCEPMSNYAECQANARLMAASPDLLEALENLENDDNSIPSHAWKLVQDAIRKAKGGAA